MEVSRKHTVIYDTDPGVDDAMALYFALARPDIDVIGVTTTFGNVTVEQAAKNALYLCAIAGRSEIPVTQGVSQPRVKHAEAPPDFIHGADGLGNLPSRQSTSNTLEPRSSAQFIVDTARKYPGEVSVVAVGPLGNLARALELEPELPTLLRKVVVMGGTVLEPGNVSPVAEANIWNDPTRPIWYLGRVSNSRWSGSMSPTASSCRWHFLNVSQSTTSNRQPTPCCMRWLFILIFTALCIPK
jgi:inosine-uridine nucleoside N-ribohydrolase